MHFNTHTHTHTHNPAYVQNRAHTDTHSDTQRAGASFHHREEDMDHEQAVKEIAGGEGISGMAEGCSSTSGVEIHKHQGRGGQPSHCNSR